MIAFVPKAAAAELRFTAMPAAFVNTKSVTTSSPTSSSDKRISAGVVVAVHDVDACAGCGVGIQVGITNGCGAHLQVITSMVEAKDEVSIDCDDVSPAARAPPTPAAIVIAVAALLSFAP